MENSGEFYYSRAVELFEAEEYEQAVANFIKAYDLGYEQKQILENIYNCFITPNEQEFQKNYIQNSMDFTRLPIEECTLDFIPVSENRFYIFDWKEGAFHGLFELEETPIQGQEPTFGSILYTNTWDIREMLTDMKEHYRRAIYILLNDLEPKFASFFKLPHFSELYLKNVIVFKNDLLLKTFFEEYKDFYLPKELVTTASEKYIHLIDDLHEKRIYHSNTERENVFLSICIPSYNRGTIALNNIRHLLRCPYDSEIEIILSNNGSTKDAESYEEIRQIKDSRIRYHAFEENQGFASNLLKTLELAQGKYAIITSDEDLMLWEHLDEFLDFIIGHPNGGVFYERGNTPTLSTFRQGMSLAGFPAVCSVAFGLNYMTGITFHMKLFRSLHVLDIIEKHRGNTFVEWYTHICMTMLLCRHKDFILTDILLWDAVTNAAISEDTQSHIADYTLPKYRIQQQNDLMEFCLHELSFNHTDFINFFLKECHHVQHMITVAYNCNKAFHELGPRCEVHSWIYQKQLEYLNHFPLPLSKKEYETLQGKLEDILTSFLSLSFNEI